VLRRFLPIGATIFGVVALIGAAGWLYVLNFSPDRGRYPVRGIDVSHHQGVIDWRHVVEDDIAFAIIKATEGGDHVDPEFLSNFLVARKLGLAVGAYHFFTLCRSGADQAANFLRTVPKDQPQLPPVVDIEFSGNCSERPTPEEFAIQLKVFIDVVEATFGQPVMIYAIGEAAETYGAVIPERRKWVRSLLSHPGHEDWTVWQYHNNGRVEGIEEPVDLNVLQGGSESLAALLR
jgi:lysozyme